MNGQRNASYLLKKCYLITSSPNLKPEGIKGRSKNEEAKPGTDFYPIGHFQKLFEHDIIGAEEVSTRACREATINPWYSQNCEQSPLGSAF